MIKTEDRKFVLETRDTTYAFEITETGHACHLYYGRKIRFRDGAGKFDAIRQKMVFPAGNVISYDAAHPALVMEDTCLELSGSGKGDLRSPMLEMVFPDGSQTLDLIYDSHTVRKTAPTRKTLPGSYGADSILTVSFVEKVKKCRVNITYSVYEKENVITRYVDVINESEGEIRLNRALSLQLDLVDRGYEGIFFDGGWAREMHSYHLPVSHGMHVSRSNTGTSSSRANPFFMLAEKQTNEDSGSCYGFNLIYSGNHMEVTDANSFGKIRVLSGINDEGFSYLLEPGETFEAPEAVMSFSDAGFNSLSRNMHGFVREHIIRGTWKGKDKPILLNSWEAAYFNFDKNMLLRLARQAADVGIELFVLDDGWFGDRSDDTRALGDWTENRRKLPGGLAALSEAIHKMGMSFGIWVEPEMVNVNSNLYHRHPDWCIAHGERDHSEGRNQRILDLTRKEVRNYIIRAMTRVFSSAKIEYVKWDMNRIFSDVYSQAEEGFCRSGETVHRYVMGLYEVMGALQKRFPDILFEGCASGGNRFDLGILCYFPQIWASDNTDPICRAEIQQNYSYGYPPEVMGAHVSASPNHQTLRRTPMKTRFAVASFGTLGYECNLTDFSREQKEEVQEDIRQYKKYRRVMQHGIFYRGGAGPLGDLSATGDAYSALHNPAGTGNIISWTVTSPNKRKAVGMMLKKLAYPNTPGAVFFPKGLEEDMVYRFANYERTYDVRIFGDLVNTVSPIHVRPESLLMDIIARHVKLPSEKESYTVYGSLLMHAGVALKQNYCGTGYDENVRYDQDFSAKMYFMDAERE